MEAFLQSIIIKKFVEREYNQKYHGITKIVMNDYKLWI